MGDTRRTTRVLVAVDGSQESGSAAGWAVGEARRQHLPMVLVHVESRFLGEDEPALASREQAGVDDVLREARQLAAHAPAVETEILRLEPIGFDAAPPIAAAAGPDDVLVLGARGHTRVAGLLLGSVSQYAARHAPGTVVVVRDHHDRAATRTVVGFDRTAAAQRALDWAMSRAAQSEGAAPVVALRAWRHASLQGAANVLPLPADAVWLQEQEQALLEAELAPWRDKHPQVRLVAEVVPGHAAHLLTMASEHADLVVVGSRARGLAAETLLGSVAQSVLHHSRCPVAVVH